LDRAAQFPQRITIVDSSQTIETVQDRLREHLKRLFG
jgi:thymidylate kinase